MDKQKKTGDINEEIRLHVFLARRGVGSRRQCEEYILEGLVRVNGQIKSEVGVKVCPNDEIEYKGRKISWKEENKVYIALYKPEKYICSHTDEEDRPLAVSLVQPFFTERLFYVGRLDYMTSGLLLLTNDGEFAGRLMHPSFEVEKEYEIKTAKKIPEELLECFKRGIWVGGERYQLKSYTTRGSREANLILTEGKNQEIRQVFLSSHVTVKRIHRIRVGKVTLRGLSPGQFRKLSKQEVVGLLTDMRPKKLRIYKSVETPIQARKVKVDDSEHFKTEWVETKIHKDPVILRGSKRRLEKGGRQREEEKLTEKKGNCIKGKFEKGRIENEKEFVDFVNLESNNFNHQSQKGSSHSFHRSFAKDKDLRNHTFYLDNSRRSYRSNSNREKRIGFNRNSFRDNFPRKNSEGEVSLQHAGSQKSGIREEREGFGRLYRFFEENRSRRGFKRETKFDHLHSSFGDSRYKSSLKHKNSPFINLRRGFRGKSYSENMGEGFRLKDSRLSGFGPKGGFSGDCNRRSSGRRQDNSF